MNEQNGEHPVTPEPLSENAEQVKIPETEEIVLKASEFTKLVEESAAYKDKYVRLLAEFDNARKRNERERAELIKYAHEEVVVELLGVFDDLERSVEAARKDPAENAVHLKGLEMILGRMKDLLAKYDVKPMAAVGKIFDPNAHEVLMVMESAEHQDNEVVEEFQRGYTLGERVVRTAKVKVAKNNQG